MKEEIEVKYYEEDEAFWMEIRDATEKQIADLKKALKFQNAISELAQLNLEKYQNDTTDDTDDNTED